MSSASSRRIGEDQFAIFKELANPERVDMTRKFPESPSVVKANEEAILNSILNDDASDASKASSETLKRKNVLPPGFIEEGAGEVEAESLCSSIPDRSTNMRNWVKASEVAKSHASKKTVHQDSTNLEPDKSLLLHEIKQLQMLNPKTAIVTKEYSLDDSYETLQLGLFQARQSVEIATGVASMKDMLKVGCTAIEFGANRYAKKWVDLNGWSAEIAKDLNATDAYNAPLQQIYRKYWRGGGQMNPFLQLLLLILGSAAVFSVKKKMFGPSLTTTPSAPPMPNNSVPFENSNPTPLNRPKMKKPSMMTPPPNVPIPDSVGDKSTTEPISQAAAIPTAMPQLDPEMIKQSMAAMAPMMKALGPMMMNM